TARPRAPRLGAAGRGAPPSPTPASTKLGRPSILAVQRQPLEGLVDSLAVAAQRQAGEAQVFAAHGLHGGAVVAVVAGGEEIVGEHREPQPARAQAVIGAAQLLAA